MEIADLEGKSLDPELWDRPEAAQQVMQQLAAVRRLFDDWDGFFQEVEALEEFAALDDPALELEPSGSGWREARDPDALSWSL